MFPDDKYRAFLLGMADTETETTIDERILEGRIDPDHLQQIEEELIDDHLFGRLSHEEERVFKSDFLSSLERTGRVHFARALLHFAIQRAPEHTRDVAVRKVRRWLAMPWSLPLAGALACAVLATIWLEERNLNLSRELAQATQANDAHERVIASMAEEQKRSASQSKASNEAIESQKVAILDSEQAALQPVFRMSPGVSRGLDAVRVLHLSRQASTVSIVLELPFDPVNTFREELLNSEGRTIWSQQFFGADGISHHRSTRIVLPAALFATGEYQLRTEADARGEEPGDVTTYLFRIRRD